MTMPEHNKELVLRFNKEFTENQSMQAFKELIAPDFVNQAAPRGVPKGPKGVLYFFDELPRPA
jgi:predicted SnoaL-like aldol condensation-catalyzing enzyme